MLDVHPPHHPVHAWRDFFIHIATIVVGLLIAVGLEQTVEFFHHRHQAQEARESIRQEIADDRAIVQFNLKHLDISQQQLANDLNLLESSASDSEILSHLEYSWDLKKMHEEAWNDAKISGSLALIPSTQIHEATYFYVSTGDLNPTVFTYFQDINTANAIVAHAKLAGRLTAFDRQQLMSLTESAMGLEKLISGIYSFQIKSLQLSHLQ